MPSCSYFSVNGSGLPLAGTMPSADFCRSIGETTDIVEKEMYTFLDRNGESLTLRPEADGSYRVIGVARRDGKPAVPGVEPGDTLLRVGDLEATGASMGTVVDALRGMPGEVRTLVLDRGGERIEVEAPVEQVDEATADTLDVHGRRLGEVVPAVVGEHGEHDPPVLLGAFTAHQPTFDEAVGLLGKKWDRWAQYAPEREPGGMGSRETGGIKPGRVSPKDLETLSNLRMLIWITGCWRR